MKSGRNDVNTNDGFTIVEVLIVLAVTTALLLSAIGLLGRSQNRTQFTQSINDINTQLGSLALNVANGYYASDFTQKQCKAGTVPNAAPIFTSVPPGTVPTDGSCVYLGRVVQFTNGSSYFFHNVIGRRQVGAPAKEVERMSDASPRIVEPVAALNYTLNYPSTSEERQLHNGLRVGYMGYKDDISGAWKRTSGVAFTGSLANFTSGGDIESGAQTVDVAATVEATNKDDFIFRFDDTFGNNFDDQDNPDSGVVICFDSGSTDQRAILTVGGKVRIAVGVNGRQGTTKLEIQQGDCNAIKPLGL